jgi:hypothetical protein
LQKSQRFRYYFGLKMLKSRIIEIAQLFSYKELTGIFGKAENLS